MVFQLFEYAATQLTFKIGGVRIGGIPGQIPTVLMPSVFYTKDRLVLNPDTGDFDERATENILSMLGEMSEKTGISTMLDVVATTETAMDRYLRYLVDNSEFPLMIDGSGNTAVNSAGIRTAKDGGFLDRVVLNSITPESTTELYDVIQETGLENALLLAFNASVMVSYTKRVELAEELVQKAQKAGIARIMIDTGVMDLPTLGIACRAQIIIKDKLGLPVGNGAHNAISTWRGLVPKFGKAAKTPAIVGSSLMPISLGADFVLMGPAKEAPLVYPSVAMIDTALSGSIMEERIKPEKPHPRYLIG